MIATSLLLLALAPLPGGGGQTLAQEAKLVPTDLLAGDAMAFSIAVDGDTMIVGCPQVDLYGEATGTAYVFVRSGGSWTQQARLIASNATWRSNFGMAVDVDGDRAVVSAHAEDTIAGDSGAVYVFTRSGNTWTEQARLKAWDADASDYMGTSVAIDGDLIAAGAPLDEHVGYQGGSVYVFRLAGGVWGPEAKLLPTSSSQELGRSLALDGDTIVAGAYKDLSSGSAYVFRNTGGGWYREAKLPNPQPTFSDYFGWGSAISGDTLVVGVPNDDDRGTSSGSAYVYRRNGGSWSQEAKLTAADGASGDWLGSFCAIDGEQLVLGAPYHDAFGAAYLFERSGNLWTQSEQVLADDRQLHDEFGWGVSISADTIAVGANRVDQQALDAGAAYAFAPQAGPVVYCSAKLNSQGCTPAIAASGIPSPTDVNPFTITGSNVINGSSGVFFYGLTGRKYRRFQGARLCVKGPLRRSVPLDSGGNPPPDDCSGVFSLDFNTWIQAGADPNLVPGVRVYAQFWYRDAADPRGSGVTDALEFEICP